MYDIETLPSAWKGHKDFAKWLVNHIQAKTIVDLGVDYGYSTFCFADPDIGQTVYGIDTFEGDEHAGFKTDTLATVNTVVEHNSYNNINIIKDLFDNVAEVWAQPIDILHIDGLHTLEAVTHDVETWSKFLAPNGVMLMHDIDVFEDVARVFCSIEMNKTQFLPFSHPWAYRHWCAHRGDEPYPPAS